MNTENLKDERIVLERRRIQSDAYGILVYGLMASILIQQFFLKAPVSQFLGEFFCLCGIGLYITLRQFSGGIDIWSRPGQTKTKTFLNSVVAGAITVTLLVLIAGEKNIWFLAIFFVCISTGTFLATLFMQQLNRKKRSKIEAELNDEETEDTDLR